MVKIRHFLSFIILFSVLKMEAQEFKLGKVSIAELEQKVHPQDSTAVAAIIFSKAITFFNYDAINGFSIETKQVYKIKIYKKEGLSWANYKVPYRIGYEKANNDKLEFSEAATYNLENGKVVKTKLKSEGVFNTILTKYWKEATITLPNVKVGSIIEFAYVLKSENILQFPVFNFQQGIPVNYAEYTTEIPGFFTYKTIKKGILDIKSESKVSKGSINYTSKHSAIKTDQLNFEQLTSKYTAENIPALKEEPFLDNIQNYRLALLHELEKEKFNDEPLKDYSLTWEGVVKMIYKDKDFGDQLKEKNYVDYDVKRILNSEASPAEKMDVIFKFVQNKMTWNNKKGYYTDKGVQQAYTDGTGNVAEINFILITMLNRAGIIANPVVLSTIENGIQVYPNRTVFNYVVAAAEIDGKRILLDAANKFTTQNILPKYTLNWTGRLIREDASSEEIKLIPELPSVKFTTMMITIGDKGKVSGQYRIQRNDYEAFDFREKRLGISEQSYLEKIEAEFKNVQISDYSDENLKDFSKPVVEKFTFTAENQYDSVGDKIYINPQFFFTPTKNPFVQEKRILPIYFGYPKLEKFNFVIEIPAGYEVASLPKAVKFQTGENVSSFSFNAVVVNDKIQISIVKDINLPYVNAVFYPILKSFYQQTIEKQAEKIVLKKI